MSRSMSWSWGFSSHLPAIKELTSKIEGRDLPTKHRVEQRHSQRLSQNHRLREVRRAGAEGF